MQRQIEGFVRIRAAMVVESHGTDIETLLQSIGRILWTHLQTITDQQERTRFEAGYEHIVDWLVSSVVNREPWLSRVNAKGVPLKLAKFGTFQQIVDEADKAMRKNNTRGIKAGGGGEVVHSFGDGWTVVRLRSSEELDQESAQMQHCVGHGAYDDAVKRGTKGIFSLRDPAGNSHVTVEMIHGSAGNLVDQVKGKQNREPRRDYFEKVAEWLDTFDEYQFSCGEFPNGWAVTRQFRLVDLTKLPRGFAFHGDVTVSFMDDPADDDQNEREARVALPEGLTIHGNLSVRGMWKHRIVFPEGLDIVGDLHLNGVTIDLARFTGQAVYIEDCFIRSLPTKVGQAISVARSTFDEEFKNGADVVFGGFASFSNCGIETALDKMSFEADLNLDSISGWIGCAEYPCITIPGDLRITRSRIKFFQDVRVGGSMVLNQTDVNWEPKSIHVGRDLRLHRSDVKSLPHDLVIGGALEISYCHSLKHLPQRAKIAGNVILSETEMSLGSRKNFNGDLILSRYGAKHLQKGLRVAGDLTLSHCDLESLPEGLWIGGSLSIKGGMTLKSVPSDVSIGKDLNLEDSFIVTIPTGMMIPGSLNIAGSLAFTIPSGVVIGRALISERSGLTELPDDLRVRHLFASDSFLEALPEDFSVEGDLDISKTVICELPKNLRVGGNADFRESEITEVPASVEIGGTVSADDDVVFLTAADRRVVWTAAIR